MNANAQCPLCGAPVTPQAIDGLCPQCLLIRGLTSTAHGSANRPLPPEPKDIAPLFPDLEIQELIGCGGMGVVYKAVQRRLDRVVALKILPAQFDSDPMFRERFVQEAQALARLTHPNIVRIYDFGASKGIVHLLMEFMEGTDLARRLRSAPVPMEEGLHIIKQMCDALDYAHRAGVVHRDIKPANILLTTDGRAKLADFGIAKLIHPPQRDQRLTLSGDALGTPLYMAPEQRDEPQDVDHRADIYSLGVVFYELLTGELPAGSSPKPSERGLSPQVDEPVLRALEYVPSRRYQHASELGSAVERIAQASASGTEATVRVERAPVAKQGRPWLPRIALALVAGLLAAVGVWWWIAAGYSIASLGEAVARNHLVAATRFLTNGEDPNVRDAGGISPLGHAIESGSVEMVALLLEHGANPNLPATPVHVPLNLVVQLAQLPGRHEAHLRMAEALLAKGAHVHGKPAESMPGYPYDPDVSAPLVFTVSRADAAMTSLLLAHGADAKHTFPRGYTFVHLLGSWEPPPESADGESLFGKVMPGTRLAELLDQMARTESTQDPAPVLALLLKQGLALEATTSDEIRITPLGLAALRGSARSVRALLDAGANREVKDVAGFTPLLSAAEKGHAEVVRVLLDHGADINARDPRDGNVAALAATSGDVETLRLVLEKGAGLDDDGSHAFPALHAAAETGNSEVLELLLKRGAKVDSVSKRSAGSVFDGCTALYRTATSAAVRKASQSIVNLGFKAGFNASFDITSSDADFLRCAKILLDAGASVKALTPTRATPLQAAAYGDAPEVIELLLKHGADLEAADIAGATALIIATREGRLNAVRKLLSLKAQQVPAGMAMSALHFAADEGKTEIAEALLDAGGDLNLTDGKGATPLHLAATHGHLDCARLFIARGARLDEMDIFGSTPLLQSLVGGKSDVTEALLAAGVNARVAGISGITAAQYAEGKGLNIAKRLADLETGRDRSLARRSTELLERQASLVSLLPRQVQPGAEAVVAERLEVLRKDLGEDHPAVAFQKGTLGFVLQQTKRAKEAIPLLEQATQAIDSMPETRKSPFYHTMVHVLIDACGEAGSPQQELAAWRRMRQIKAAGTLEGFLKTTGLSDPGAKAKADPLQVAEADRHIGQLLVKLDQKAEAEPLLRQAIVTLKELLGSSHASVVEAQNVLDDLDRQSGRHVKPQYVGRYARADKLVFIGNAAFTADQLHTGLLSCTDFILAVHPSELFDRYLEKLQACLVRGYQRAGFASPQVVAAYDDTGDVVRVRLAEGARYKWGTLKITGCKTLDNEKLLQDLLTLQPAKPPFGKRVCDILNGRLTPNGPKLNPASPVKPETETNSYPVIYVPETTFDKDWKEGDDAELDASAKSGIRQHVAGRLAVHGFLQPVIEIQHTPRVETGTVDTVVTVDEGVAALLERIDLTGNKAFKREDLLRFLNLQEGMKVTSGLENGLHEKIARSLRFVKWDLHLQQAALGSPNRVLVLEVLEYPGARPLDQPLTADEEELVKIAAWLTMLDQTGYSAVQVFHTGKKGAHTGTELVLHPSRGLVMDYVFDQPKSKWKKLTLAVTPDVSGIHLDDGSGGTVFKGSLPLPSLTAGMYFSVDVRDDGSAEGSIMGFGGLKNSNIDPAKPFDFFYTWSPCALLHLSKMSSAKITREGGVMVIRTHNQGIRWNCEQQRIEHMASWSIPLGAEDVAAVYTTFSSSAWETATQRFASLTDARPLSNTTQLFSDLAPHLQGLSSLTSGLISFDQVQAAALLWDATGNAIQPWFKAFTAGSSGPFFVPNELSGLDQANSTATLIANTWFGASDMLLPKDSWLWEFFREMFYLIAGRAERTPAVLKQIASRNDLGPLSCLAAEAVLRKLGRPEADAFRQLAKEKNTLAGFQEDWNLLMKTPSGLRDTATRVLQNLSAFDEQQIVLLTKAFDSAAAKPLHEAAAIIRSTNSAPPEQALWPIVGKFWTEHLEKRLGDFLAASPVGDPTIAAMVNGVPITRKRLDQAMRLYGQDTGEKLGIPLNDMGKRISEIETAMLAGLIEMEVYNMAYQRGGGVIKPEDVDTSIRQFVETQFGGSGDAFNSMLESTQLTLDDFRALYGATLAMKELKARIISGVAEPGEVELKEAFAAQQKNAPPHVHLHRLLILKSPSGATPEAQREIIEELRQKAVAGADFEALAKANSQEGLASEGGCMGTVAPESLNPAVRDVVLKLKPREVSQVVDLGGVLGLFWIKELKPAPVRSFEQARAETLAKVLQQKQQQAMDEWLRNEMRSVNIVKQPSTPAPSDGAAQDSTQGGR